MSLTDGGALHPNGPAAEALAYKTGAFVLPGNGETPLFESLTAPEPQPCSFGRWLNTLDEKSRSNLIAALDEDSGVSSLRIRRNVIDEAGKSFSADTISAHRQEKCLCSSL